MLDLLNNNKLILMEGSIVERVRRLTRVKLHHTLACAPLIYDNEGKEVLREIYGSYMDVAEKAGLPFLYCTSTRKANAERVKLSGLPQSINLDNVRFLRSLRDERNKGGIMRIGGLVGVKNDAYKPDEALETDEAKEFHSQQINELCEGGVDFLIAQTLPSLTESLGIALAMEETGVPYIISFVVNRNGFLLDNTPLMKAIQNIDNKTGKKPAGYAVNCAYPSFLCPERQPKEVLERLIGYMANASSLDHSELDSAPEMKAEPLDVWGDAMLELNKTYGVKILGGCCGTTAEHLSYIVENR